MEPVKLRDLPLGSLFRYMDGTPKVYVLLSCAGRGLVADNPAEVRGPRPFQGLYSAAESLQEFEKLQVLPVVTQPAAPVARNVKACALSAIQRAGELLTDVVKGKTMPKEAINPTISRLEFAARALKGETSLNTAAPVAQCACCPEGLLDSFTGGAAPEGLFGRVTLLINGQRVDYAPASQPVSEPSDDELTQSMLKACPFYGPSPSRDAFIMGWERAVSAIRAAPAAPVAQPNEPSNEKLTQHKHPAEVLADWHDSAPYVPNSFGRKTAEMLRRIPALEAERDQLRAEVKALREANSTFATAAIDAPVAQPLACAPGKPGVVYVDGFGYVDERAVRAIERAYGIGQGVVT